LAVLTEAGCPFTVEGGAVDGGAVEGFALLLLQAAAATRATNPSAALAKRTNGFLRVDFVKVARIDTPRVVDS
jgi:hypothetical protein